MEALLDVIEDGVTGWLVPHGDIERLSRALESLLADPVRAREMGARGRERLAQNIFLRTISNSADADLWTMFLLVNTRYADVRMRSSGAGV